MNEVGIPLFERLSNVNGLHVNTEHAVRYYTSSVNVADNHSHDI